MAGLTRDVRAIVGGTVLGWIGAVAAVAFALAAIATFPVPGRRLARLHKRWKPGNAYVQAIAD